MQVTNDRLGAQHEFAVEFQHQAQHAVGGRMRRAHVDDHGFVVAPVVVDRIGIEVVSVETQYRSHLTADFRRGSLLATQELLFAFGRLGRQSIETLDSAHGVVTHRGRGD